MNSIAEREFNFTAEHFRLISERMYQFSGIRLPEAKREMVYARLARRLRSLGIGSFDDYVRFLELEPAEWEHGSWRYRVHTQRIWVVVAFRSETRLVIVTAWRTRR